MLRWIRCLVGRHEFGEPVSEFIFMDVVPVRYCVHCRKSDVMVTIIRD